MEVKHWELRTWKELQDTLTNEQFQKLNSFQWEYYNALLEEWNKHLN